MAVFWNVPPTEAESCSYSHILRHPGEPLSLRVSGEMDAYANAILHESDTRFSDYEVAAIDFLNRESLSESYKEEYIQRSDTVLKDINAVTSHTLWPALMKNQRVAYTWQNIADYFAEFGKDMDNLSSELSDFINSGSEPLDWSYNQLNQRIGDQANGLLYRDSSASGITPGLQACCRKYAGFSRYSIYQSYQPYQGTFPAFFCAEGAPQRRLIRSQNPSGRGSQFHR